jgi:hypothetical protein
MGEQDTGADLVVHDQAHTTLSHSLKYETKQNLS